MLFERQILCFSLYKNHESKVKLKWVGACERKNSAFFVSFVLAEGNFLMFLLCVNILNKFVVYITMTYHETLLNTHFTSFAQSSKVYSVSLSF